MHAISSHHESPHPWSDDMCRLWLKLGVAILFLTARTPQRPRSVRANQNVRIIAPFAAGGTADVLAGFWPTIC